MHEDIQVDFFLLPYCQRYLVTHRLKILQIAKLTFFVGSACMSNF
jgi:hypothetical protein